MALFFPDNYTIGWICALPLEMAAAKLMLDNVHPKLSQARYDHNAYLLGDIAGHNVVVACLPSGVYGTTSAAVVAQQMLSTFPSIRIGLVVGIGGGAPNASTDIRLGDVVVSKPTNTFNGVVQYDYGKTVACGRFQQTGALNKPPQVLLTTIAHLESNHMIGINGVSRILTATATKHPDAISVFSHPGPGQDLLFESSYEHVESHMDCLHCDPSRIVPRTTRPTEDPQIHYGLIASANQVMKHGETRDRLAKELHILCFEMEAAGLMDHFPCLVIRGICDYADSHKNKQWQGYAAITAAAYAKELLSEISANTTKNCQPVSNGSHLNIPKGVHTIPFDRNPRFAGRHVELQNLESRLFAKDQPQRSAITGLGGIGKTQIALELAYRVLEKYPGCSIFWVQSTMLESVEQAYMDISHKMGIKDVKLAEVKTWVKLHLSQETSGQWLLIFDNADDMDMWTSGSDALKNFLPRSSQGHILFTTRNRKLAVKLASSNVITIPEMDEETATVLLRKSLIVKDLVNDLMATTSLLHLLTFLPLAITQAASYVNENGLSLADYVTLLQEQEADVIELLSEDFEDEGRYSDIVNPVATTWLISFHEIQRLDQLAADYLSLFACVSPRDIPLSLLPPPVSRKKQMDALGLLNAYSFISMQIGDNLLSLHRLVHLATRNWLKRERLFAKWTSKTADRLKQVFPENDYRNRALWQQYLPHAQIVIQSEEFENQKGNHEVLLEKVGQCLYSDGRYIEAETMFKEVLAKRQEKMDNDHEDIWTGMAWVAATYQKQGRWREAEDLQVQVVEARRKVLGLEHPDTLTSIAALASTYWNLGRWKECERLEVQVLETRKRVLGQDHQDTLAIMAEHASTYANQGLWGEAELLQMTVLKTQKSTLGPEHPDTLMTMADLASTYSRQGRFKESEELDTRVLESRIRILGQEHPDTLTTMADLASTYWSQGRWKEAEELEVQVLETHKRVLGQEHPRTLIIVANLALTYLDQGQYMQAENLGVQVLEARKRILGQEHQDTITSMANLALTYKRQGQWQRSEELEVQVLEARQRVLGEAHPDTLSIMFELASTHKSQGRLKESEELIQALEARKKVQD